MNHWPQYIVIALYITRLLIEAAFDGEIRNGKYSGGAATVGVAISVWVLWCGGFWEPILK